LHWVRNDEAYALVRFEAINLKVQIEEDKRIEEALKEQLEEKDKIIGNLEAKIVTLRKDIQKKNI
jgi:hypothetical protein